MLSSVRARPVLARVPALARSIQTFEVLDSDIHKTQSGKTIITQGSGGRASRTGYTATVFGANGFIGTYLASKLARKGTITVVPFREEMAKRHLKPQGDLGVVNFVEFDLRNIKSIEDSVRHSDIVFNCIGRNFETKNFSYHDVHVEGAKRIAEAVRKYNVSRFIHLSSYNADPNSSSLFYKSKGLGEQVVRDIVPDATIVRPGPVFGDMDKFLNKIASSRNLINSSGNTELMRPVLVNDVARALEKIGYDDSTAGKTFELYGPDVLSRKQIIDMVRDATFNTIREVQVPKKVDLLLAELSKVVWWAVRCPEDVERSFIDQVVDPNAETFASLNIRPETLKDNVTRLVRHHRSYLYSHDSVETDAKRRKEREYVRIIH